MTKGDLGVKIMGLQKENERLIKKHDETKGKLKRAVNELCLMCEGYKMEHEGRCDGCIWKAVRHGDL